MPHYSEKMTASQRDSINRLEREEDEIPATSSNKLGADLLSYQWDGYKLPLELYQTILGSAMKKKRLLTTPLQEWLSLWEHLSNDEHKMAMCIKEHYEGHRTDEGLSALVVQVTKTQETAKARLRSFDMMIGGGNYPEREYELVKCLASSWAKSATALELAHKFCRLATKAQTIEGAIRQDETTG